MSGKKQLLLGDSDSDGDDDQGQGGFGGRKGFEVNTSYATKYNAFREKEVYQRLKDKYGDDASPGGDDGSSDDEEEDEDGSAFTPGMEKAFFSTLAALKTKDPAIYNPETRFFSQEAAAGGKADKKAASKKEKAVTLVDMERKVMLEKGGRYDELEDEELARKAESRTFVQEMEDIKQSLKAAVHDDDDEDGDGESEDEGLLSRKTKSKEQEKREETEYKKWLAGQKEKLEDEKEEEKMKGLRDFWNQKNLAKDEKFLRDYILKKGYLDDMDGMEDDDNDDDGDGHHRRGHDSDEGLSEDEANLQKMEEFEHKFNFRYEEPDPEFIKRYPRTIKDSMRREDSSRKKKREAVKERKEREKEKKREELKQLKALKRKEIMDKIGKLKKIAGNEDLQFEEDDLEADFDPAEHDRRMASVFEKYDAEAPPDDEKPVFSDLDSDLQEELEVDNWDGWEGKEEGEEEEEGGEENGDEADPQPGPSKKQAQDELVESTKHVKRRRKSKFAEAVERSKPMFRPEDHKTFESYLDEYYKLDYEDLIGDVRCRFRYRDVEKNDFGLSVGEILSAPDRELNSWCSLKKTCQYRTDEEEQEDVRVFKGRGNNMYLKKKLLPSLFSENPEAELQAEQDKRSKRGKKRKAEDAEPETPAAAEEEKGQEGEADADATDKPMSKSAKKRLKKKARMAKAMASKQDSEQPAPQQASPSKKGKSSQSGKGVKNPNKAKKIDINADIKMSDDRLAAYGLNPSQFKRKEKKKKFSSKNS